MREIRRATVWSCAWCAGLLHGDGARFEESRAVGCHVGVSWAVGYRWIPWDTVVSGVVSVLCLCHGKQLTTFPTHPRRLVFNCPQRNNQHHHRTSPCSTPPARQLKNPHCTPLCRAYRPVSFTGLDLPSQQPNTPPSSTGRAQKRVQFS
jgi:hypothetical protein